jgi:hypothetical protein
MELNISEEAEKQLVSHFSGKTVRIKPKQKT